MGKIGYLKPKEIEDFLDITRNFRYSGKRKEWVHPIALLMLHTGMRISEVVGEKYDYFVDDHGNKISPKPSLTEAKNNDYEHIQNKIEGLNIDHIYWSDNHILIPEAKGNKPRTVPITQEALNVLRNYLKSRGLNRNSHGHVFNVSTVWVRKMFAEASTEAGISRVHPHRLRDTFAVYFLQRGGDIRVLQMILGHSSINTTQQYLKYADDIVDSNYHKIMGGSDHSKTPNEGG